MIDERVFSENEKIIFALRKIYLDCGYKPYRMSKFEEYDLYADNKSFLISNDVITFTDVSGKLMALKPDVTLSIIKNSKDEPDSLQKVYYSENVYRAPKTADGYKEIMQTGLECFGAVDSDAVREVISLAVKSLALTGEAHVLGISDLDVIEEAVNAFAFGQENRSALYKAISERNVHEIRSVCASCEEKAVEFLVDLVVLNGELASVIEKLRAMDAKYGKSKTLKKFICTLEGLPDEISNHVTVDFSLISDINYYNGVIFQGYVKGYPDAVLSGGQYDKLMAKMSHKSKAIGFAVYTDELEKAKTQNTLLTNDDFINVALPKGRLGEKAYDVFAKAGYDCPSILENNRKLTFENVDKKIRYFWVKPSDVAIYVERGAADIGVAGKDILLEYAPQTYELLDLDMGKCKMAVAAPKGYVDDKTRTLRVATKFSNIAKDYYLSKGRDIDIIHLNGSIELAPILGLSDVIVDIVETGTTLRENNLEVVETVVPISARLIANRSSAKFKDGIEQIVKALSTANEVK